MGCIELVELLNVGVLIGFSGVLLASAVVAIVIHAIVVLGVPVLP